MESLDSRDIVTPEQHLDAVLRLIEYTKENIQDLNKQLTALHYQAEKLEKQINHKSKEG
jgi:predicted  nucleic acid-binding Zn-ribbon protein